jgi:hypothetical protein
VTGRWACALVFAFACGERSVPPHREPVHAAEPASSAAAAPAAADPLDDEAPPPAPPSDGKTVTIKLVADARRGAHVFWGRKDLGAAPLAIERPQGSGPMDLLVSGPGLLPLHTRVFTDHDETLAVRLYTDADARGLLGYHPPAEKPKEKASGAAKANTQTTGPSRASKPRRPF